MASKLTSADISEITRQSDVISKPVRDNFTNTKNKINELVDEIAAVAIGTTNAETTAARPYNSNLKERLDQVLTTQYRIDTGGVVSINAGDSQKVDVTAGTGTVNGIQVNWSATTSATISYTSANTRYDVVVINTDNTLTIVTGAEAAIPVLPSIASTQKALWVLLIGTASVALNHDARDQGCYYNYQGHLKFNWKIQDAIDDLTNGGTIYINRGTYIEGLTYDDNQNLIFEGGTVIKDTSGTTINFEYVDLSTKSESKIEWSGGIIKDNDRELLTFSIRGTPLAISGIGNAALAALSSTRVAFIDNTNDDLRTYDFNGSIWSQTGNDLNIAGVGLPTITGLTSTRIAFIDDGNDDLRTYDFDGTDWSQAGNDLNIGGGVAAPAITALSSSRIAFIDAVNEDLRTYDFDGTDWSQTGNDLNIATVDVSSIAALSSTRVAFIDGGNKQLRAYDFDGTDWTLTGNSFTMADIAAGISLSAITSNTVVFTDNTNRLFRILKFDGTNWTIISLADYTNPFYSAGAGDSAACSSNQMAYIDTTSEKLTMFNILTIPTFLKAGLASIEPPS